MAGMHEGRKYLILGIANKKSIAWGIAEGLVREGAQVALTYMNEAIEKRVRPLAEELGTQMVLPCDVQSDEDVKNLFVEIESRWGALDGIVHSVAYADKGDLDSRFSDCTRAGFQMALDISAYSLIALCKEARPLLAASESGGSILTLSYYGAEKVVEHYNVMGVAKAALEASVRYLAADLGPEGVRVNALSAGPIKTLAASGIPRFREMLTNFSERAPLRRNVTVDDVAKSALYFMSPMASGVTGEVQYVDCGFNIIGL